MVFLSAALKRLSLKLGFQRGRRLMFKTYFETAKVGTSCHPKMDSGLDPKIGSDGGHRQLSKAPLDAFGIRLPAKLSSSRHKSFSGGRPWAPIAINLLNPSKHGTTKRRQPTTSLHPVANTRRWEKDMISTMGPDGRTWDPGSKSNPPLAVCSKMTLPRTV